MAQQHLTLLLPFITLLLACCVTPSLQQAHAYSRGWTASNGTLIAWPLIEFDVSGTLIDYPQVYVYNQANLNPITSMDMTTEFFDVNTSEILWSQNTLSFRTQVSASSYDENLVSQTAVISPCQVALWNPTKRLIGVRSTMLFSTTSVYPTTISQTIKIDSTLVKAVAERSTSPTTYKTILIPASSMNNTRSMFQVNGSLLSTSSGVVPFESFCFNQQGSCSNTNCLARGDIAAGSASKTFSVDSLPPSGVYYLSLNTTSGGDDTLYYITVQVTASEGHRITNNNNLLISVLLPICTLVFIGALQC